MRASETLQLIINILRAPGWPFLTIYHNLANIRPNLIKLDSNESLRDTAADYQHFESPLVAISDN